MIERKPCFQPLAAQLEYSRRGVLWRRDCYAGPIPKYMWPRIMGRKVKRQMTKVVRKFDLFAW